MTNPDLLANAGWRAPTSASVAGSSYGITTNEANQKIAASINSPLPSGVTPVNPCGRCGKNFLEKSKIADQVLAPNKKKDGSIKKDELKVRLERAKAAA